MLSRTLALRSFQTRTEVSRVQSRPYSTPVQSHSKLTREHVEHFKTILDKNGVIEDENDLVPFNSDWMGKYKGCSSLALLPKTTEQVSKILAFCNSEKLAVVPQSGNTGLVGGSIPIRDEIVINLRRMNKIHSFSEMSGACVCDSGVILAALDDRVRDQGYVVPLDLGARGSCMIGGNIATNAGGIRLLRYGSLHGSVLGLEVVLPDGRVLDTLNVLKKDNTGYDLKQLFIGSEGTLGIITKAAIACAPYSNSVNVAVVGCKDFKAVEKLVMEAKKKLGEIISALELIDGASMDLVLKVEENAKDPLEERYPLYVLVETQGSNEDHDRQKLEAFFDDVTNDDIIEDGILAQDASQVEALWYLRENITESLRRSGCVYKYDISLPGNMYDMCEKMATRLGDKAKVFGYGHVGDGNLHLNILTPKHDEEVFKLIEPYVYEYTAEHKGSVSAEHGLGQMKADKIHYSKSDIAVDVMRSMKTVFDPNGILNPNKVLPSK